MAGRADPWADVDFDEIMDATCLEMDDIKVLFNCFQLFDTKKQDYLLADDIDEVMRYEFTAILTRTIVSTSPFNSRAMGFRPTAEELAELIEEIDEDGSGAIEFPEFAQLCAKFLVEDPDPETMRAELKQAFRLFDKQGTVRFTQHMQLTCLMIPKFKLPLNPKSYIAYGI